jgi:adenine-specific DNA-methyltransferase
LERGCVPLVYPLHIRNGFVQWPPTQTRKANAIEVCRETESLFVPTGTDVLVRRFGAKEERRRIAASLHAPERLPSFPCVDFENHLNYFHAHGRPLDPGLARGLAAFLNTSAVNKCFRQFSGHTQVNATDLRRLRYPSQRMLRAIGQEIGDTIVSGDELDAIVKRLVAMHRQQTGRPMASAVGTPGRKQLAALRNSTMSATGSNPMDALLTMMDASGDPQRRGAERKYG